jgi:hypothetical protein
MERNTDWKVPVALILAGLALFVALNGRDASPGTGGGQSPAIVINGNDASQPRIVVGNSGTEGSANVAPAPNVPASAPGVPYGYADARHFGFGHGWSFFPCFPLIGLALLLFFFFRFSGRRNWQRYAHGAGPWQGHQGQQGPGPQPGQGPGRWVWQADEQASQAGPGQGDNHGDITRPGQGNQE